MNSYVEKIILLDAQSHASFKASHAIYNMKVKWNNNTTDITKTVNMCSLSLSLSRELFFYFESLLLMATIFTRCLEHNKKIQIESDKSH